MWAQREADDHNSASFLSRACLSRRFMPKMTQDYGGGIIARLGHNDYNRCGRVRVSFCPDLRRVCLWKGLRWEKI
ncbi:hypothetical protein E2C01_100991 [Portunus trituberculatus]|uniref:Uncharacterized protein n=1 Tax=Portunus trituberculatus TaxID=210409 RepID=A0A5B7KIY1_PORTR|nr:hypothetical protein [Portunus trituberculatus]